MSYLLLMTWSTHTNIWTLLSSNYHLRRQSQAELIFDAIGSACCIIQGLPSYLSHHPVQTHQVLVKMHLSWMTPMFNASSSSSIWTWCSLFLEDPLLRRMCLDHLAWWSLHRTCSCRSACSSLSRLRPHQLGSPFFPSHRMLPAFRLSTSAFVPRPSSHLLSMLSNDDVEPMLSIDDHWFPLKLLKYVRHDGAKGLTTNGGGRLEDLVYLRIHCDVHLALFSELLSSLLQLPVDPICKVVSNDGVDHISNVATMKIFDLSLLDGECSEYLFVSLRPL